MMIGIKRNDSENKWVIFLISARDQGLEGICFVYVIHHPNGTTNHHLKGATLR